jgi:diguanylate cyclase (GGDEF)-like protein
MSAPDSTLLAEVLRHALDGIAIVEGAANSPRVVYANATLAALLRRAEDWTIGRSLDEIESEAPADPNVTSVGVGLRVRLRRADGTSIECERWALVLPDARLALHYRPLSRAAGTLAAAVDRSSGLCTPEHLMEVLRRDWSIAQRDGGTLTLMQFDVDDTAEYREVFGRGATENVLRQVGRAIATSMRRTSDVIAHLADDEFGVLGVNMEANRAAHHAEHIASRIRALAIHHPRSRTGRYLSVAKRSSPPFSRRSSRPSGWAATVSSCTRSTTPPRSKRLRRAAASWTPKPERPMRSAASSKPKTTRPIRVRVRSPRTSRAERAATAQRRSAPPAPRADR